ATMLLSRPVLLLKWVFLIALASVNGNPPEEPIKCPTNISNCTITNSYGAFPDRSICHAAEVAYPSSEEELVSVVAYATQAKRKMRVATRYSHSIPKLVCPDGDDGLIISTKYLNRVIEINQEKMLVTIESGVTLELLDYDHI
ncbi:probable L-gulonolactone oxidase 6, partial [Tanacetum coccineum]